MVPGTGITSGVGDTISGGSVTLTGGSMNLSGDVTATAGGVTANGTAMTLAGVTASGGCNGSNCDWEAVITGLDADAVYEYQVPTDSVHAFQTCPAAGKPMDIVFYGDSRDGEPEHVRIVAAVMAQNPDMVFESGDIQFVINGPDLRKLEVILHSRSLAEL